ncbi:MAG: hypothetical protein MJ071_06045 [Oscillospiraceae bacterium]|nr:hypothetical protein [Oscillospiraceae bacterium]
MQEYQGKPCMVCGRIFEAQDDIVSCPECGTPYHRDCWKQNGCCINQALHESGESWLHQRHDEMIKEKSEQKKQEEQEQAEDRERGDGVRLINGEMYDGVRLTAMDPCCGMDPEEVMDGAKLREVAEFVQTNRFYYLPLFRLMKRTGKKTSFNLTSLICPQFWFASRKMWGLAVLALLVETILTLPAAILSMNEATGVELPWVDVSTALFQGIYQFSWIAVVLLSVLWGMFSNYFYYRFTVKRISSIKKSVDTEEEMHRELQRVGGTSFLNVVLMLGMQFVLTRVVLFLLVLIR